MRRRTKQLQYRGARHWAAPFVLVMLCLRALVPAGFMLAPIDGRLDVVLCDADATAALHRHGHHDHSGQHHTQLDPTCPYAQSAGPAPLPVLPVLVSAPITFVRARPVRVAQTQAQFGPARLQFPRGPPRFA
jgi:Protein of unknown function (DUF2946)